MSLLCFLKLPLLLMTWDKIKGKNVLQIAVRSMKGLISKLSPNLWAEHRIAALVNVNADVIKLYTAIGTVVGQRVRETSNI